MTATWLILMTATLAHPDDRDMAHPDDRDMAIVAFSYKMFNRGSTVATTAKPLVFGKIN